jgi:hypothetical protein
VAFGGEHWVMEREWAVGSVLRSFVSRRCMARELEMVRPIFWRANSFGMDAIWECP